jgi:hypothetical protein
MGPNQFAEPGAARLRSSDWLSPLAEDSPTPPGNSAELRRQSNSKRKEFDPKGPIEDIGPKETCHQRTHWTMLSMGLSVYQ